MGRVDLDQFQQEWRFPPMVAPLIEELVAELRVAREQNDRLKADLGIVGNELERMRLYAEALRDAMHDDRHVQHIDDPGSG